MSSAEPGRLLIVEDEQGFAQLLNVVATDMGYAVRVVLHSPDLEFQLSGRKPTAIFLDVFMPHRDGLELLGSANPMTDTSS